MVWTSAVAFQCPQNVKASSSEIPQLLDVCDAWEWGCYIESGPAGTPYQTGWQIDHRTQVVMCFSSHCQTAVPRADVEAR